MDDKDGNVISHLIGDFGKWQATISLLVSLLKLPIAWFQLSIVFLAPIPEFWCDQPLSNVTRFNSVSDVTWRNESLNNCDIECNNYEFNVTVFKRTIISEVRIFSKVCFSQWRIKKYVEGVKSSTSSSDAKEIQNYNFSNSGVSLRFFSKFFLKLKNFSRIFSIYFQNSGIFSEYFRYSFQA